MADPARTSASAAAREDARAVLTRLRSAGHVAYLAGGCVRDLLLGREPTDFDVATDAPPPRVRELFRHTQAVGAAFGVVLVRQRASQIEVATFRADGAYVDGRHPSDVRFTTAAEEDARRRDFTINGLFLDPIEDRVIDYVGGRADLAAGLIRAIGEPRERFDEDSLRLLRAVRFSARLDFAIEPQTAAAILEHAAQLKRISPERVADELRAMLVPPTRVDAWRMLCDLRLVDVIFRFMKMERREAPADDGQAFAALAPGEPVSFGLSLAVAAICYRLRSDARLDDPRKLFEPSQVQATVQALRQSLKISNDESEQVRGTLAGLHPLLADEPPSVAIMKRFLAQPTAPLARQAMASLVAAKIEPARIAWLRDRLAELEQTEVAPAPLIDGDVLAAHGLRPGPIFKRVLNAVYDAQLEGQIEDRNAAIEMALRLAREQTSSKG